MISHVPYTPPRWVSSLLSLFQRPVPAAVLVDPLPPTRPAWAPPTQMELALLLAPIVASRAGRVMKMGSGRKAQTHLMH